MKRKSSVVSQMLSIYKAFHFYLEQPEFLPLCTKFTKPNSKIIKPLLQRSYKI